MKLLDHPLAELFPLLPGNELQLLADDIYAHGQEVAIVLYEGKILDGRNRARAAKLAKVEPKTKEYRGNDPLAYVLSHNLHRRHLSESQRAMIAAQIATRKPGGQAESANLHIQPTQDEAAEAVGVSVRSVSTATKVLASGDTELIDQVKSGEVSVTKAAAALPAPKKKKAKPAGVKYDAALERVGKIIGKKVKESIEKSILKIDQQGVIFWASLKDNQMADIEPLVVGQRWKPQNAWKSVNKMVTDTTRIADLINLAIAGGGEWVGDVNGYAISVKSKRR